MVGQLPISFLLTGSDPMSQLQPVRILQCEAKGHVFLHGTCDFRHSYLQLFPLMLIALQDRSLKDMAISAHTYLLIGRIFL